MNYEHYEHMCIKCTFHGNPSTQIAKTYVDKQIDTNDILISFSILYAQCIVKIRYIWEIDMILKAPKVNWNSEMTMKEYITNGYDVCISALI